MNSKKIEQLSVEELKKTINLHDLMSASINEGDKEPSYDGMVLLYSGSQQKVEELEYRVPIQVKGKNDASLLKRSYITYPVEYKHLRNYFSENGVCFFVVVVSDDGLETAIFISGLTTLKLKDLLKNTDSKSANQRKNITLKRVRNNSSKVIYQELMQFGHDSKKLGSGLADIVKNTIEAKDLKRIDQLKMTAYASSVEEAIHRIEDGEACLFAHFPDSDIWWPMSYEEQRKLKVHKHVKVHKAFGIDGKTYYDHYVVEENSNTLRLHLSENLYLDLPRKIESCDNKAAPNGKFKFTPITSFEQLKKDVEFLLGIEKGSTFTIEQTVISHYTDMHLPETMKAHIEDLCRIFEVFDKYKIYLIERYESFTNENWDAINKLMRLYKGQIKPNETATWYVWKWGSKAIPFFLVNTLEGAKAFPYYDMQEYIIGSTINDVFYPVPVFSMIKRDVWSTLYNPDERWLLSEIERTDKNDVVISALGQLFVEVLAAYDLTHEEWSYRLAECICKKLLMFQPEEASWKINQYQIYKRKRSLIEEEYSILDNIADKTESLSVKCAAHILLSNKYQAKKILEKMPSEERAIFVSYPIFTLLGANSN